MTTKLLVALFALFAFPSLLVAQDGPEGVRPERARRAAPPAGIGRFDSGPMREEIRELVREAVREALAEDMPGARREAGRAARPGKQGERAQRGAGIAKSQRGQVARRFPGLRARGLGIAMRGRAMRGPQADRGPIRDRMEALRGRIQQMRQRFGRWAPTEGDQSRRSGPERARRGGDRAPL